MLKLIAALLMVTDHIALIFFSPTSSLYLLGRLLGRLSMPIFAYKVACGYLYTQNFKSYLYRLTAMTLVSQLPFTWLLYGDQFSETFHHTKGLFLFEHWNIGLTFLCALLILKLLATPTLSSFFLILLLGVIGNLGDYGLYGIGMVIVFYTYKSHRITWNQCFLLLFSLCIYQSFSWGAALLPSGLILTLPALFSLFLIHTLPDSSLKLPKNFFYIFYPLHMVVLLLLKVLL